MAPIPESSYFPSLDRCLDSDLLLISWKTAFYAFVDTKNTSSLQPSPIRSFFEDQRVKQLLAQPFSAFPKASPQTKTAFDTKTAAINVPPSAASRFDIKQIKEDALWLSQEVDIDEISALRVAVVEYQARSSAQLLSRFSNEELAGIHDAVGQALLPVAWMDKGEDAKTIEEDFNKESSRRLRLLSTYLTERQFLLKCMDYVLQTGRFGTLTGSENNKDQESLWRVQFGRDLGRQLGDFDGWLIQAFSSIRSNLVGAVNGSGWKVGGSEAVEVEWANSQITEATYTMEIAFQILDAVPVTTAKLLQEWLDLLAECVEFFNRYSPEATSTQDLMTPLQSMFISISLAILRVDQCTGYYQELISTPPPYIADAAALEKIHDFIMGLAGSPSLMAGPMLLVWSHILRSMQGSLDSFKAASLEPGSDPPLETYMSTLDQITTIEHGDTFAHLARVAVDQLQVFELLADLTSRFGGRPDAHFSSGLGSRMRIVVLDLIAASVHLEYFAEVVSATVSAINGGRSYWDFVDSRPTDAENDPVVRFLQDPNLTWYLDQATARYPFESLPFLRFLRTLGASLNCSDLNGSKNVVQTLEIIPSFSYTFPAGFRDYETYQETEDNNSIRLTRAITLFEPRFSNVPKSSALVAFEEDFTVQKGTIGRIVCDSPKVAFLSHSYSGLKYFGRLLETLTPSGEEVDATTGDMADRESAAEIIAMLATLVFSAADPRTTKEAAERILEVASSSLQRNRDIISVVFDIFEDELANQSANFGSEAPLDLLVSCVQFIHALAAIKPERVWPLLGRSALLDLGRGGGKLASIVGSVEVVSGRYKLLLSCVRLYETLVEDLVSNEIVRKCGRKPSSRFTPRDDPRTGVSDKIPSQVILAFTRFLVDVLESSCGWKFLEQDECRRIRRSVASTFAAILQYTYGIEKTSVDKEPVPKSSFMTSAVVKEPRHPLLTALEPSAAYLVDIFLSPSPGSMRIQPLLHSYYDGIDNLDSLPFFHESRYIVEQVVAVLTFSRMLLQVSTLLERPTSQLEKQLFQVSPLTVRLYAANDAYRIPVLALLQALILGASRDVDEPPSLLGHLGQMSAINFLYVLSDLDKPLLRDAPFATNMSFSSKILSSRQQWFAYYLLTGRTSKQAAIEGAQGTQSSNRTPLNSTLHTLSKIGEMPKIEALGRLEFVALAQNYWPWPTYSSPKYEDFMSGILEFIGRLPPLQKITTMEEEMDACYQSRMAAYVAEIIAMHLFHSRQVGKAALTKTVIDNLSYFTRFGVELPKYNVSLHSNLKKNFAALYPGVQVLDFKRTELEHRPLGKDYVFDIALANKMLGFSAPWGMAKGLEAEVARANVNLSLVDSQIALLHSWKFLAIELSTSLTGQIELQKTLAKVAKDCMISNRKSEGSEEIFTRLNQTRADLALILIQRLVEAGSTVPEMQTLLESIWETFRESNVSFGMVLDGAGSTYYRSLLKLIFLGLRVHAESPVQFEKSMSEPAARLKQSGAITPIVIEIFDHVVAKGLRDLAAIIHDDPANSVPEDLALITAILQAGLRVPGIEFCYSQVKSVFVQNDSPRLATTLFSWSDSLAIDGDPIYGELSILFLLELSTVPTVAEVLAVEGLLGHLGAANITTYLLQGKISPFAEGAGLQRCYSIWSRGFLPLLVNLLDAVGVAVAAEVALFLNQFPGLLKQSSEWFDAPEVSRTVFKKDTRHLTLGICSEVNTLSLVLFILNGFRVGAPEVDIPPVEWDAATVFENVEFWLSTRALLRDRILPMGDRDIAMSKRKAEAVQAENALEAKVVLELMSIQNILGNKE